MLQKVLVWSSLGSALLFVILTLTALFGWASLGDVAPALVFYGAVPLLAVSILLAVALLVMAALASDS